MAVQTEESNDFDYVKGYAECIAQAANSWAYLEYYLNQTIWSLADTAPALGACMTAQIINVNARMSALLALMKLRGISNALIGRTNKFADRVRGPNELRNRLVHDMWFLDKDKPEQMGQLTISAAKKLLFSINSVDLPTVEGWVRDIIEIRNEAMKLAQAILAEIPTLPEIPHASLHPITEHRGDP